MGSNPAGDALLRKAILLPHTTSELDKYVIYNPPPNAPVTTRIGPVVAVLHRFHGYVLLQTVALTHVLWLRWASCLQNVSTRATCVRAAARQSHGLKPHVTHVPGNIQTTSCCDGHTDRTINCSMPVGYPRWTLHDLTSH